MRKNTVLIACILTVCAVLLVVLVVERHASSCRCEHFVAPLCDFKVDSLPKEFDDNSLDKAFNDISNKKLQHIMKRHYEKQLFNYPLDFEGDIVSLKKEFMYVFTRWLREIPELDLFSCVGVAFDRVRVRDEHFPNHLLIKANAVIHRIGKHHGKHVQLNCELIDHKFHLNGLSVKGVVHHDKLAFTYSSLSSSSLFKKSYSSDIKLSPTLS
jgi:hypothetical protein